MQNIITEDSMRKKLLYNFFYQASYQLLLIIMPIITIPITSRALGPEGIGTYQYVFSIAGYFVLIAGLGIQNYGVREIAVASTNKNKISEKFWQLFFLNLLVSTLVLILYVFFIIFFDSKFKIYFIVQLTVVFSSLWDISWFFGGLEDFKTVTIRNFIIKITTFALIVLTINTKEDLLLYFIIMGLSTLLGHLSLWLALKKKIVWIPTKISDILKHLKPTLTFFIAKIAFQFYYSVSITLLGTFGSMTEVGYFSNGYNLIAVTGSLVNALNIVMIPRMSNLFSSGEEDEMIKILEKSIDIQIYFSIAITFGIITINSHMISWFYGDGFEKLKIIVPLIALGLPFQIVQTAVASQYLIPKNHMKSYNLTVIVGAMINFLLSLVLIPYIGIYGALIGYLVSYILLCILRSRVLIHSTNFKFNWRTILGSVFSGGVMFTVVWLLTNRMQETFTTTIFQIALGATVFILLSELINISPIPYKQILKNIRS